MARELTRWEEQAETGGVARVACCCARADLEAYGECLCDARQDVGAGASASEQARRNSVPVEGVTAEGRSIMAPPLSACFRGKGTGPGRNTYAGGSPTPLQKRNIAAKSVTVALESVTTAPRGATRA